MSDDKLSSSSNYTISSVTNVDINTKIVKRPYAATPFSSSKKQNRSNSFKDTLNSVVSHNSSDDNSEDFSKLLNNELNDSVRLQSQENSRVVKSNFQNNTDTTANSPQADDEHELQPKTIDSSAIYKKIQLLNSLKK
ncbi:hypothetical protein CDLVIII_1585 [Clostridium sp. DL-VIII]|uniref:hypothetical protein n=1 Tax=Clostridium sp. DL-VIII TaxID=641107 RepID=UPI00023AFBE7|nr:hypothetical protein [Clostridium sp. DL-VIII]EHI98276.1 hypothetical protein CDLVIII_1585 [Clostridium sp. DL-VIII]